MTELSLNEFRALVCKAARGAGLPWGLATDVAHAAVWLETHAQPSAASLIDVLKLHDVTPAEQLVPDPENTPLQAPAGVLSSALVGAYLADDPDVAETVLPLEHVVGAPLLQAFVPQLTLSCLAQAPGVQRVELVAVGPPAVYPVQSRVFIEPEALSRLNVWAPRTYAPATEHSRIAGAGAGVSDND